jgi:RNA-directed DNA polymerase
VLQGGGGEKRRVRAGRVESAGRASPDPRAAETATPQPPPASESGQGKQQTVHARRAKGFGRNPLALAWETGQKTRGRAGGEAVPIGPFAARQESSVDLPRRKRRDGTSRPQAGQRGEIPQSEGGVRKRGLPAVRDRVGQQALGQRREPSFDPRFLDRSFGSRQGRSPHDALRQGWQAWHAGGGGRVAAELRQVCDPTDQATRSDLIAAAISEGRVLPRLRASLCAGVLAGGGRHPTRTGVPPGGVASPWWPDIFRPPFARQRAEEGCRRTRWADAFGVRGQTREEAPRAVARAERFLREELGVERPPPPPRRVQVSQGCEGLGSKVKQGTGPRLPASKRRRRAHPPHLYALPRAESVTRGQEQMRALTRRQAPVTRREVSERINPVIRGWGHCYPKAEVRGLFPRLERWIEHRLASFLATRWRNPRWRRSPTRRLIADCGRVRLTHRIPGLVHR